jgi:DNA-binding NarL/FixJ family response regulator
MPDSMAEIRVIICDDARVIREGIAMQLDTRGIQVIGQASNGEELLALMRRTVPDVVILDIRMPPNNNDEGLVIAEQISKDYPDAGILLLSTHDETDYARRLAEIRSKGIGYLVKDRLKSVEVLCETIESVAHSGIRIDEQIVSRLLMTRRAKSKLELLSPQERKVLELIAQGRSNSAIENSMALGKSSVERHVTSLIRKLDLNLGPDDNSRVRIVLAYLEMD